MASSLEIERLRSRLYQVVERCQGNLLDPRVIEASQSLDRVLVRHMNGGKNSRLRVRIALHRTFTPMRRAAAE